MGKVLIADDDKDISALLEVILLKAKHEVAVAHSKEKMLEQLDAFGPELVLLDVNFGVDDGRLICKDLKQQDANLKIMLISARHDLMSDYYLYKADNALQKPFNMGVLLNEVKALLY